MTRMFEQQLLARQSMKPIQQIVLGMAHAWLATAYRTVRKFCSADQVSAFVTDACLCHPSRARKPKLESNALAHKHEDGSDVFRVQDAEPRLIISSGLPVTQDTAHANVTSISDDEQPAVQGWRDFYETDDELAFDEALRLVEQGQSVFLQGFGAPEERLLPRRLQGSARP